MRDLEPRKDMDHRNTVASQIARKFFLRSNGGQAKAGPCFLVKGEGKDALVNAAKVLVDGAAFPESMPPDEKVSLVFYSYPAPGYVHLKSVHRSESAVTVKYQVVTHRTLEATAHFALIPLGNLESGKFRVEAEEVPPETPYRNHKRTDRAACDSCTFTIQD